MRGKTFWEDEDLGLFEAAEKRRRGIIIDEYIDNCNGYSKRIPSQTDIENMRPNGTYDYELLYNRYRR